MTHLTDLECTEAVSKTKRKDFYDLYPVEYISK
jgi:hypothetical protein